MRKARNRNSYKATKALTNAGSAALATAPSGNPFLIGGTALVAGVSGYMQEPRTFDPNPFRRALKTWSQGTRRRGRRAAQEAGVRSSARLSAKGVGGSELAASITHGAERAAMQHAEDLITDRTAEVEDNIAHAQLYVDEANRAEMNRDWQGLASAAITAGYDHTRRSLYDPQRFELRTGEAPPVGTRRTTDLPKPDAAGGESVPKAPSAPRRTPEVSPRRTQTEAPTAPSVPRRERERIMPGNEPEHESLIVPSAPRRTPSIPEVEAVPRTPGEDVTGQGQPPGTAPSAPSGEGSGGASRQFPTIPRRTTPAPGTDDGIDTRVPGVGDQDTQEGQRSNRREIIESDPVDGGGAGGRHRTPGGGRDDQIHPEDAPKDRRPIDPPDLPDEIKLDENSTRRDVQEFLNVSNINPSSRLGQMVAAAPADFGFVVQTFGVEWLKDVFTFA